MDLQALREYIVENDMVPHLLESMKCHHVKRHTDYFSCANPDGDNLASVNVYIPSLSVVNYTRDLDSASKYHDIFTLVQFYNSCGFFEAVQFVCNCLGLSVYHDFDEDLPDSLIITREILKMVEEESQADVERPLRPIPEKILSYYIPCVNDIFKNDGISYNVQKTFEIGYDTYSNRITIPIRNYNGDLIGVKGRYFGNIPEGTDIQKYIYLEPCNKSQVLFGLDKTYNKIEAKHFAFVGESEKFVMQLWSYGDQNAVATGGKTISKQQIEMLSRICDRVILCLDKDVEVAELKKIADKFLGYTMVYTVVDEAGVLGKHESPSDDKEKWRILQKCLKRLK